MQALINGASGFIGGHLHRMLADAGWDVSARRPSLNDDTPPYAGSVVFHLAALAHQPAGGGQRDEWLSVNRDLALREYGEAAANGAAGFVFVSSAKVFGETSAVPLAEDAPHAPQGIYAESKHLAELALREAHAKHGLPLAIVRPPLVYGPGVKAGFRTLLDAIKRWPMLPLGAATARRSMVSAHNLCHFLQSLAARLEGCTAWHATDGEALSVRELVERLASLMDRRVLLLSVPRACLFGAAGLVGQRQRMGALLEPLLLDDGAARRELQWQPPQSVAAALTETVRWYRTVQPG